MLAFAERTTKRFRAAIERFRKILERIDSRIIKIEERGVDLSESKILAEKARENFREVDALLLDVKISLDEVLQSDSPKEIFTETRGLYSKAKEVIFEAHKALVEVIKSVKSSLSERKNIDDSEKIEEKEEEEEERE